jgi:hypothetical protein
MAVDQRSSADPWPIAVSPSLIDPLLAKRQETVYLRTVSGGTVVKKYSVAWIAETVEGCLSAIDDALAAEIAGLVSEVSCAQDEILLVFVLRGETAFERFPVDVMTFNRRLHERDSPIHCRQLLAGRSLLDPSDDYPLGRADLAGASFLEDLFVVQRAVMKHFLSQWRRVGATLPAYIGMWSLDVDERTHQPLPGEFLNLNTGEVESLTLTWNS